jgi:uncharacterized protein YqjF (DUF2071 family)
MRNEWRELTFLHWAYDPDEIQPLLPDGLTVETWGDYAWVGLVPFRMHVRTKRGPYVPWISHFPETNLRTYVRGPTTKLECGSSHWRQLACLRCSSGASGTGFGITGRR